MILVADSGSTKSDWLIITSEDQLEAKTMGFNPFFHSTSLIGSEILKNEMLAAQADNVDAVFFYGASCSSDDRKKIVSDALTIVFPNATTIVVDHDLTGAAIATCGETKGITCILGTGSNSCFFDGTQTHEKVPALGYILGDEGSGSFFGKILVSNYLYNRLPQELSDKFDAEFNVSKEDILYRVYNQPNANVYLASFMKFISSQKEHPYLDKMIYDGLSRFIDIHVTCYEDYRDYPVHFVGSIAYYFGEILGRVSDHYGFKVGAVVKKPVIALGEYHAMQFKAGS